MKKNAFFRTGLLLLGINIFFGGKLFSQNLLQNGGFECGGKGTGFNINSSFYTDVTSSLPKASSNVGDYAVTTDPYNLNSSTFLHGTDHSGSGKMLVCDGITTGGQQIFWQAGSSGGGICGLTVGATYYFSYWVKSVSSTCTDPSTCASLAVKFNNNSGGQWPAPTTGSQLVGLPAAGWQQVVYTFVPTNACVNIEITNNNTNSVGNDFALDDMSVVAAVQPALALTQTHTSPTCYIKGSDATDGTDGTIFGYASGGSSPYVFNLTSTNLTPAVSLSNATGAFTGLLSGTYNLSVTDSKSATVSVTGIVLGHLEDTLKTGNDTSICLGGSANLSVTGGYNIPYVWSPSGSLTGSNNNPVATPGSTTTYLIHSDTTITITSSQNLITNGDFESGNVGFYSDYTFNNNNSSLAQKVYGIVTNPQTFESGFTACATHGGTKQLVADGSTFLCGTSASDKIWAQTVNVVPGTTYTLTYYAQTVSAAGNPAQLSVKINGTTVGATASPTSAACNWLQVTNTWTAPVGVTAAEIALYDLNSVAAGNDFAIDDISFIGTSTVTKNCKLTDSIKVTILNPVKPVISCGTSTISSVQFTWPAVTNATSYNVSYSINNGSVTNVGNIGNTLSYTVNSGVASGDNVKIIVTPIGGASTCFAADSTVCSANNCFGITTPSAAQAICTGGDPTALSVNTTFTGANAISFVYFTTPQTGTAMYSGGTLLANATPVAGVASYNPPALGNAGSLPNTAGSYYIYAIANPTPVDAACRPYQEIIVTVSTPPNAGTLSGTQNICVGGNTTFASTQSGGAWSSGDITIATINAASGVITGVAAGTATITYTVNGSGGCANATATRTVTVTAAPNAGTLSGTQNICVGGNTTFASTQSGGAWSSGDITIATINAASGVITGVAAGTATITYTVNGSGGCANATATRTVTVTAPPNAGTLSGTQNICVGGNTTFASTQSGGAWSSGDITIATINAASGVITGVAAGTATITYTVNGSGGCANATATRTVTVTAAPNAGTLSGTQNICVGGNTTFASTQSGGAWSSGDITIATINAASGVIIGVAAGTATITYTVNGSGGCANATATRTVTVTAPPNAGTLSGTQNICVGGNTTFASTQSGGAWSSGDITIATINAASGVITGVAAGTATITYTVNGSGGCANATATRTVTVTAAPNAGTLSGTQNICVGGNTTFASTQSGGAWSSGDITIATINAASGVITGVAAGMATITYTVNGSGGCANATATRTVTVTAAPNAGTLSGTQNICVGGNTTFASTQSGGAWSSGDITIATINAASGVITGVAAGTATITYTVNGSGGCANAMATRTVTVTAPPNAGTLSGTQNICVGGNTTFTSTQSGGAWSSGDITIATINAASGVITGVAAGTATITYTVNGSGGCANASATRTVTVKGLPSATISGTTSVCQNATNPNITFTGNGGTTPYTFTYSINGGSSLSISTSGTNSTVTIAVPTATSGNKVYDLISVADGSATSCSATINGQSTTVTVIGTPATPTGSVTIQPTCTTNGTIVITAPTGAGLEYSIDGSNYQTSTTFAGITPATYNVTVRTTSGQCVSAPLPLTVNAPPGAPAAPTASVTTQPTCITTTGTITITAPTGANLQYTKDGTTYQTGTTFTGLTPGATYNINVKDFSSGCISAATTLTINNIPANPATPTASVTVQPDCANPNGTIVVTAPTGASIQYSIDGINYQSSGTFTGLNPGNTYNITAKNTSTGCVSSANSLTVNSIPGAPAAPTASVTQQPNCYTPTGTIVITAPIGANLQYSNGGAYQSGTSFTGLTPGNTYNITVKNTITGCVSNSTVLTINALPANPAAPTASVTQQPNCVTPTGTITITAPTGVSYEYSKGGTYQTGTTFTNLSPNTSYNITTRDVTTGCVSSATSISVNALPANPATPTASVTDAPSCITPTGTITITNPVGNNIRYSIDGSSYQSSAIFSGLTPSQSYAITAKDVSTGCTSSARNITIPAIPANPVTPTASVTQQPNCITTTGTITITAPSGSNIEYSIDGNAYQISNIFSGLTPGNSYSITAKNILTGCISSPKNVNINTIPNGPAAPTVIVTAQPTCIVQTGTISITAPTGAAMLYTIDGSTYSSTKIYSGLLPGSTYTVIAKDNTTGCTSGPSIVNINGIPANPVVNAGPDKEILQGQNATLNGQATGDALTYVWTPNIAINNTGVLTPTVNPTNDQVYTLTATSKDGCVASDNVKITVVKDIVVPNAFSPNEDNINDTWIIENINYYPNADIKIFNRYGQFVFESRGYQIPWDGTYKGQKVPVGTYFWIIKLKPDSKPRSGSVSVIR